MIRELTHFWQKNKVVERSLMSKRAQIWRQPELERLHHQKKHVDPNSSAPTIRKNMQARTCTSKRAKTREANMDTFICQTPKPQKRLELYVSPLKNKVRTLFLKGEK